MKTVQQTTGSHEGRHCQNLRAQVLPPSRAAKATRPAIFCEQKKNLFGLSEKKERTH